MSVWVSTLFKFRAGIPYGSLSHRLSIEIPKGERTGLTPAQRKVYGKSQMVRPRRATLLAFAHQNKFQILKLHLRCA